MGRRPKNYQAIVPVQTKASYSPQKLQEALEKANSLPKSKKDFIQNVLMNLGQLSAVTTYQAKLIQEIETDVKAKKAEFKQALAASEPMKTLDALKAELRTNESEYNACLAKFDGIYEEMQLMEANGEIIDADIKALIG
ncbi:MAG TPA: hypothetical protein DCS19_01745 [Flavobacterium sp.]|nr:hypothetical protein [Flavobacterium sp.]